MKKVLFAGLLLVLLTLAIIFSLNARRSTESRATTKTIKLHYPSDTAESVEICASPEVSEIPTEIPTEAPTEIPTEEPSEVPTAVPTPEPTEAPTPEPETEQVAPKLYFLATAYSSDPAENGGFGAVDCLYGRPLPEDAIAADLSVLPYGTRVYIDGIGERVVVDTAGPETLENMRGWAASKKCEGWIDIYVGDNKTWMHDWGVRVVTLTVLEWGPGR